MKIHRTRIEDREAGLSMPEIMLGLSVIAIVAAAGITAYNNVQPRVRANSLYAGMQGFMVDAAQYLTQYHSEENETALTGNASNRKTFAATSGGTGTPATNAAIADITITCTTAAACPNGSTSGTQVVPNPNMQRWTSMPSLRYGDSRYDEDVLPEWHIPIDSNTAVEVAFEIMPADSTASDLKAGGSGDLWGACTIDEGGTPGAPDTAVLVEMAIEEKDTCDNLAQMVDRLAHVQSALCYDNETNPALEDDHFHGRIDDRESLMVVCFSVL